MKMTVLLGNDQSDLRQLIEQFRNTAVDENDNPLLMEIGQQIRKQLRIHSQAASEVFYPAHAMTPPDQSASTTATAEKRCEMFESLFRELSRMKPSDADFEGKVDSVIAEIGRHIAMQEDELIHEAQKAFLEYRFDGPQESEGRFYLKMLAVI